jgi:hypothetical protein
VSQFGAILSRFLSKYPFARARIIAGHFGVALDSVKMNLARELALRILKMMQPDRLSDAQKSRESNFSRPSPNS